MTHKVLFTVATIAALMLANASVGQDGINERRGVPNYLLPGSRTVIGQDNELLSVGSQAMLAGRWEDGIRLTLRGLERPGISERLRAGGLANLCAGYAALMQPDLAIDYCTQSLDINDQNWRAWSNRSYAFWMKKEYERAGEDLEHALAINTRARQLFVIRGMLNEAGLKPRIEMEDRQ